jgi:hypothetical protein
MTEEQNEGRIQFNIEMIANLYDLFLIINI